MFKILCSHLLQAVYAYLVSGLQKLADSKKVGFLGGRLNISFQT